MAGSGIRVFASGEILTAAQVNGYLMDQTVTRFSDSATRDAAFGGVGQPTLTEGRICYLDDVNLIQFYDGSTWVSSAQFAVGDGTITNAKLAANSVTSDKIAAGTVIAADIAAGTITATELATGAVTSTKILDGTIVNGDINAAAAIDKTKISGTAVTVADTGTVTSTMIADGTIVNGDINASAGIALSKLATSTAGNIIVYNASGVPTAVAETGDITISDTGVTAISSGVIVDADINASAAIALSKLATGALPSAITVASANITDLSIVNADVNASAAIAHSKLANATAGQVLLGTTTTGVVTATTVSGDVTITGAGVTAIASGVIVDADVNASAAIALSKLASGTSAQVIIANASGVPTYTTLSGDVTISNTGVATIAANSVALGTDTTGNYMVDLSAGTGIAITHTPSEGSTATVALADVTIVSSSVSYGLTISDKNKIIEITGSSSASVTVPTNSSQAFPVGSQVTIIRNGTGTVRVIGPGVTLRNTPGEYLRAQYSSATLIKRATDEWYLVGDLSST